MSCQEYETLIALYVEGDVEDRGLERHLSECAECRDLLEDLRASQAMLKELTGADPALLSVVRTEVLARIGEKQRFVWRWIAAIATAVVLLIAMLRPGSHEPIPIVKETVVRNQPTVRPVVPVQAGRRGRRPLTRASAPPRGTPSLPLVVKMLTDDPNIVIIWLVDQPGD
jgi:hypothetical protein